MDRQGRKRGEKENVIGVGVCLGRQRLTAYFRSYTPLTLFLFPFQGFSYRSLPPPVPYAEPALSIYSSLPSFLHSFHLLLIYFTNHLLETTMPHLQGAQKNEQKTEATSKPQVRTLIIEHENLKYISWVCLKLGCCLFWCQPFLSSLLSPSLSHPFNHFLLSHVRYDVWWLKPHCPEASASPPHFLCSHSLLISPPTFLVCLLPPSSISYVERRERCVDYTCSRVISRTSGLFFLGCCEPPVSAASYPHIISVKKGAARESDKR